MAGREIGKSRRSSLIKMTIDLKHLREVAVRADGRYGSPYENQWPPNRDFHRLFNPTTALALIDELERLRKQLKDADYYGDELKDE